MGLMEGKSVMITGATGGIGYYAALEIARMGASVTILGRDQVKCISAVQAIQGETGNPNVASLQADFSSLAQVRTVAQAYLDQHDHLDVLINNAGTSSLSRKVSADGFELSFAVNHLAHFLLTNLLVDALIRSPSARVVTVSSGAHLGQELDFDNLQLAHAYAPFRAYGRSKLANILFAYELARLLEGTHVTSNVMTPGMVATEMWRKVNRWIGPLVYAVIKRTAQTPAQGAETITYLASSPEVDGTTGQYYAYKHPIQSSEASHNVETARRLWKVSAELTGVSELNL